MVKMCYAWFETMTKFKRIHNQARNCLQFSLQQMSTRKDRRKVRKTEKKKKKNEKMRKWRKEKENMKKEARRREEKL